jgi:hypothetical protein
MSDFILMDNTYTDMLAIRRKLVETHEKEVIGYNPIARDAVTELYTYVFGLYLPKRYPSMFVVETVDAEKSTTQTRNLVTDETIALEPPPSDPKECLKLLVIHVDCEFAVLLPEAKADAPPFRATPTTEPTQIYYLHAFALAFPSGFNTARKLGLPLAGM